MIAGLYKNFDHWHIEPGKSVWVLSDPHFGDKDLAAGIPNRPADEELIKKINSKVGKKDTLICLGDVGDIECARRLKGYKILICGNHDKNISAYETIFDEVYRGPLIISEKIILSHEPLSSQACEALGMANFHGHKHQGEFQSDKFHFNFCVDVINYDPINLNTFMKQGKLKQIQPLHRQTIDNATKRVKKRGYKLNERNK